MPSKATKTGERAHDSRAVDPERASELAQQATDAMLHGDFETARAAYQRAIAADPSYAAAQRGLGLVLERLGRKREAAAAFRQFLRLRPSDKSADKIRERLRALDES